MKKEYDFSRGKRGAVLSNAGKTRITIYLDNKTLQRFKAESERTGKGYQTLITRPFPSTVRTMNVLPQRKKSGVSFAKSLLITPSHDGPRTPTSD